MNTKTENQESFQRYIKPYRIHKGLWDQATYEAYKARYEVEKIEHKKGVIMGCAKATVPGVKLSESGDGRMVGKVRVANMGNINF